MTGEMTGEGGPARRRAGSAWVTDDPEDRTGNTRDRDSQRAVLLEIIRFRFAAAVVIGACIAVIPAFGPYRVIIGVCGALAGIASNLVARNRVRAGHRLPRGLAVADLLTALAVIVLVPQMYAVAVIVIVSMTGLFVFWFGRSFTFQLVPLTAVGLLAIGLWFRPQLWVPAFIAWAVSSVFATAILSQVADAFAASRDRYDELVNGIDAAVWEAKGPAGPPDYLSDHVVDLLGFSPDQLRDLDYLRSRIHPEDLPVVIESRRRIARGENVEAHFRIRDAAGRTRQVQDRVRVTIGADGRVVRRRGVLVDETARWEAESSVRRYADFIEGIPIALVILRLEDPGDHTTLPRGGRQPRGRRRRPGRPGRLRRPAPGRPGPGGRRLPVPPGRRGAHRPSLRAAGGGPARARTGCSRCGRCRCPTVRWASRSRT